MKTTRFLSNLFSKPLEGILITPHSIRCLVFHQLLILCSQGLQEKWRIHLYMKLFNVSFTSPVKWQTKGGEEFECFFFKTVKMVVRTKWSTWELQRPASDTKEKDRNRSWLGLICKGTLVEGTEGEIGWPSLTATQFSQSAFYFTTFSWQRFCHRGELVGVVLFCLVFCLVLSCFILKW